MITELLSSYIPGLTPEQGEKFRLYFEMLTDWNTRMNLTAITDEEGVAQKHFSDSVLPAGMISSGARVADVGTGAGFPGVPLKIVRPDIELVLIDSLGKRVNFLSELVKALGIKAECIHARAEDAGRSALRESFDTVLTRAVANVSVLTEYTLPLLKVGGESLMYKGPQAEEELSLAAEAVRLLHGKADISAFDTPWGERRIIRIKKLAPTDRRFPRKAGTAEKQPL